MTACGHCRLTIYEVLPQHIHSNLYNNPIKQVLLPQFYSGGQGGSDRKVICPAYAEQELEECV